jgi:signal transduction histidine kinase
MTTTEEALKERIKELTCLYEITSVIVHSDISQLNTVLKSIAFSLKKAFQNPETTDILIDTKGIAINTANTKHAQTTIKVPIKVFNKPFGEITVYVKENTFLEEEQDLLENVAIKIGNLLERIEISENEQSLKRQMERADRLNILGEITAGIAHELNTPLANILGFAELMKNDLGDNKNAVEDVDKIIKNAKFSREVVKKLMFFACEMPQEMKHVNIVPSIKNAIHLLDATFRKQQVKYIVTIEDDEIWLRADTIQLTQIIFNLLMNAIYFSPKDGLVTIEALQTKKDVILKISDEGKGLSDEALEKIFQPFFTTKPTGDGSGLGLSVVHGIIASHKGTITAQNNPNKGAIFTVTLPKS